MKIALSELATDTQGKISFSFIGSEFHFLITLKIKLNVVVQATIQRINVPHQLEIISIYLSPSNSFSNIGVMNLYVQSVAASLGNKQFRI